MKALSINNYHADHFIDHQAFRQDMLAWYDRHQRVLPWRSIAARSDIDPHIKAYCVWLSEIMLQQTVVKAVMPYFEKFLALWPSVHDLAQADENAVMEAWAGLGYYSRAKNLHKCAKEISTHHGGRFPDAEDQLIKLPGIGPYTAAAITSIAFNKPAVVIDGNVDRILVRLYALEKPIREVKKDIRYLASDFFFKRTKSEGITESYSDQRHRDFAQSLMDLGASICIPKTPRCMLCPVRSHCLAMRLSKADQLPVPPATKQKPQREGVVYIVRDAQGRILIEKRSDKGILASTYGFPTSDWTDVTAQKTPLQNDAIILKELFGSEYEIVETGHHVKHVFTHFSLSLAIKEVRLSHVPSLEDRYYLMNYEDLTGLGMPSLFDKVRKLVV